MQVLITHGSAARTRALQFHRWQLLAAASALVALLLGISGTVYHVVFLKAAREGWPLVSPLVRLIVRDEVEQRERFMRDNLDAMAVRLGEMQAKLVRLEAMGDRVAGLVDVKVDELRPPPRTAVRGGGRGGPYLPAAGLLPATPSLEQLREQAQALETSADFHTDLYTLVESRLMQNRLAALMIPSSPPLDAPTSSGFGFRADPFDGRPALHTGLDFPAETGTVIRAAAGGIVVRREAHPAYGLVVEVDHGNAVLTRYAHASGIDVEVGALVQRGQPLARVGSTGRSTGPHLHFEVLVGGVPQDPARFLATAPAAPAAALARADSPPRAPPRR